VRGSLAAHAQHFTLARLLDHLRQARLEPEAACGFRLFSLPWNLGEDWRWYHDLQRWLGARLPALCVEVSVRARKPVS
jgi:hypothetical protein